MEYEIKKINELLKKTTEWSSLKKSGTAAIPSGDSRKAYDIIEKNLKNKGIFIVPVGEIEQFVPVIGGHGPAWVNEVLIKYPDLASSEYDEIKKFVESWGL